jgi:hypothetical protein
MGSGMHQNGIKVGFFSNAQVSSPFSETHAIVKKAAYFNG